MNLRVVSGNKIPKDIKITFGILYFFSVKDKMLLRSTLSLFIRGQVGIIQNRMYPSFLRKSLAITVIQPKSLGFIYVARFEINTTESVYCLYNLLVGSLLPIKKIRKLIQASHSLHLYHLFVVFQRPTKNLALLNHFVIVLAKIVTRREMYYALVEMR